MRLLTKIYNILLLLSKEEKTMALCAKGLKANLPSMATTRERYINTLGLSVPALAWTCMIFIDLTGDRHFYSARLT